MLAPLRVGVASIALSPSLHRSVDDLKEIGDLELYIDQTLAINIFLSHWYFKSSEAPGDSNTIALSKPLPGT